MFWSVAPLLLLLFALFALGLHGERVAPALPGVIEIGLTSGREALRARATTSALVWPLLGWFVIGALGARGRRERATAA